MNNIGGSPSLLSKAFGYQTKAQNLKEKLVDELPECQNKQASESQTGSRAASNTLAIVNLITIPQQNLNIHIEEKCLPFAASQLTDAAKGLTKISEAYENVIQESAAKDQAYSKLRQEHGVIREQLLAANKANERLEQALKTKDYEMLSQNFKFQEEKCAGLKKELNALGEQSDISERVVEALKQNFEASKQDIEMSKQDIQVSQKDFEEFEAPNHRREVFKQKLETLDQRREELHQRREKLNQSEEAQEAFYQSNEAFNQSRDAVYQILEAVKNQKQEELNHTQKVLKLEQELTEQAHEAVNLKFERAIQKYEATIEAREALQQKGKIIGQELEAASQTQETITQKAQVLHQKYDTEWAQREKLDSELHQAP